MNWKSKSRSCRQGRKEDAAVRRRPTDPALIQPWWSRSSRLEQHMRNSTSQPCRRFKVPATSCAHGRKRTESRIMGRGAGAKSGQSTNGAQASGGRSEGVTAGPALDPVRHQGANGESGGGGDLNTPGSGPHHREGSRTPRGRRNQIQEDENL